MTHWEGWSLVASIQPIGERPPRKVKWWGDAAGENLSDAPGPLPEGLELSAVPAEAGAR